MKKSNIHQLIEQQDKDKKDEMFAKFEKEHNLESKARVVRYNKKRIWAASIAAAAIVICVIIAIPLLLNNTNRTHKRYFSIDDCVAVDLDYSVKEYAKEVNKDFLYIDWYDIAEEFQTWLFVNRYNSEDVIYINETIVNGETGDIVDLYIIDELTTMEAFSFYEDSCNRTATIDDVPVNWYYRNRLSTAMFKYKGYKYFVVLQEPMEEESVLKIVADMIP